MNYEESLYEAIHSLINQLKNSEVIYDNTTTNNVEFHVIYEFVDDNKNTEYFQSCCEINRLLGKSNKIKENDPLIVEDDTCNICCDKYVANQFKRVLPECCHTFHKKCIDKWLKQKGECPICRKNFLENKI
jgi:hypothetical protein